MNVSSFALITFLISANIEPDVPSHQICNWKFSTAKLKTLFAASMLNFPITHNKFSFFPFRRKLKILEKTHSKEFFRMARTLSRAQRCECVAKALLHTPLRHVNPSYVEHATFLGRKFSQTHKFVQHFTATCCLMETQLENSTALGFHRTRLSADNVINSFDLDKWFIIVSCFKV